MHLFHCHTFLSDGELSPIELIRRCAAKGYRTVAITDHVGAATMGRVIEEVARDCELARRYWEIEAIVGIELTHVPAASILELAAQAREYGAAIVAVHGETPVEPVEPGTNLRAVSCPDVDILAHPGLLTEEEARLARENGVFLEITSKRGHCWANGRVVEVGRVAGARWVINSDAHLPDDLLDLDATTLVLRTAGMTEEEVRATLEDTPAELRRRAGLP